MTWIALTVKPPSRPLHSLNSTAGPVLSFCIPGQVFGENKTGESPFPEDIIVWQNVNRKSCDIKAHKPKTNCVYQYRSVFDIILSCCVYTGPYFASQSASHCTYLAFLCAILLGNLPRERSSLEYLTEGRVVCTSCSSIITEAYPTSNDDVACAMDSALPVHHVHMAQLWSYGVRALISTREVVHDTVQVTGTKSCAHQSVNKEVKGKPWHLFHFNCFTRFWTTGLTCQIRENSIQTEWKKNLFKE